MAKERFIISDREIEAEILLQTCDKVRLLIEGRIFEVSLSSASSNSMCLVSDSKKMDIAWSTCRPKGFLFSHENGESKVSRVTKVSRANDCKELKNRHAHSPMPGKVTRIFVRPGEEVDEGAPLVAIEAMKMEHILRARQKSYVKEILCCEGDTVQGHVSLLSLE